MARPSRPTRSSSEKAPAPVRELDRTILVPPDFSISRDRGARLVMVPA
jgi:hypothetical protein